MKYLHDQSLKNELWKLNLDAKVSELDWFIKYINPNPASLNLLYGRSLSLSLCIGMSGSTQYKDNNNKWGSMPLRVLFCRSWQTDVFTHLQSKLHCLFGVPIFLNSSANWGGEKKGKHQPWAQLCTLAHPMQPDLFETKPPIPASMCFILYYTQDWSLQRTLKPHNQSTETSRLLRNTCTLWSFHIPQWLTFSSYCCNVRTQLCASLSVGLSKS